VCVASEHDDFIIFKIANGQFEWYPRSSNAMHCDQTYRQLGIDETRKPDWEYGVVQQMTRKFNISVSQILID
jgi:hypothetical protein